jgi:hypothetical protein
MFTNYSTCFIFNLLAALLEIGTSYWNWTNSFHLSIGFKKICVVEESAFFTSLTNRSIRSDETGGWVACDLVQVGWFTLEDLVEVGHV